MPAPKSPAPKPEFSLLSLARMLWKRKLLASFLAVTLSAVTFVVVYKLPAVYRSEALVLVDSQKIPEKYVTSTVSSDLQDRLATINQEILSSTRLKKIIDDFDLYRNERKSLVQEEIIEMMRKDIHIRLEKGWTGNRPGAFRIAYQGPNPTLIAQVANRIAGLYIEEDLRNREVQAVGTSEFIQNQLQDAKKKLDELEAAVSRYKLQHNGELPQQENSLNGTLTRLQIELQGNQDAINRAQQNKLMIEDALSIGESAESTITHNIQEAAARQEAFSKISAVNVERSPETGAPRQKRSEALAAQLRLVQVRYGENHPDVKRMREDIAQLQKIEESENAESGSDAPGTTDKDQAAGVPQKQAERQEAPKTEAPKAERAGGPGSAAQKGQGAALSEGMKQTPIGMTTDLARARERTATLKSQHALAVREMEARLAERQRIMKDIGVYQARMEKLPVREQEMAGLTRDYEISKANYRSLLDKKISAEMATDMERRQKAERFTMLDAARVPEKPSKPNRPILNVVGCALSLVIGIAAAISKELHQGTVLGEWELPPETVIIGRVPRIEITPAGQASAEKRKKKRARRKWRLALVSSALLSLLVAVAAGVYAAWKGF